MHDISCENSLIGNESPAVLATQFSDFHVIDYLHSTISVSKFMLKF